MLYAVIAEDVPASQDRRALARDAHLKRLRRLQDDGRLVLAGPFPTVDSPGPGPAGVSGSLIVAEFEDLDDARRWAESDPYLEHNVYARVTVKPFKQVLP